MKIHILGYGLYTVWLMHSLNLFVCFFLVIASTSFDYHFICDGNSVSFFFLCVSFLDSCCFNAFLLVWFLFEVLFGVSDNEKKKWSWFFSNGKDLIQKQIPFKYTSWVNIFKWEICFSNWPIETSVSFNGKRVKGFTEK